MAEGPPPGRARRLWAERQLDQARRAAGLLDRKRQILRAEDRRADQARRLAAEEWADAWRAAARAGRRAEALAGVWAVEVAADPVRGRATVEYDTASTVGVPHPGPPRVEVPVLPAAAAAAGGPLVTAAAEAHRRALAAAARLAVADRTYRCLHEELRLTERRHRAIEDIRIPALEEELRRLGLWLDELERQDRVVARWVATRRAPGPAGRG